MPTTVVVGGVLVGIVMAVVFVAIHRRLGDPFIEVITALTIPYTAYIAAESLHVSGVALATAVVLLIVLEIVITLTGIAQH